jgi:hypothetical protein
MTIFSSFVKRAVLAWEILSANNHRKVNDGRNLLNSLRFAPMNFPGGGIR